MEGGNMIRILICCGGGFSSSALAIRVVKEIKEKGLEEEVAIDFSPFSLAYERMRDFDVIMCCPHLKYRVKEVIEKYVHNDIPVYVLPPRMYGTMYLEEVYQDAKDILASFASNPVNPFCFEGEQDILRVQRFVSYRKAHKIKDEIV